MTAVARGWQMIAVGAALAATAGCGGGGGQQAPVRWPAGPTAKEPRLWTGADFAAARRAAAAAAERRRHRELAGLARAPSVEAALRRAYLRGAIGARTYRRYKRDLAAARAAARRLGGARGAELGAVVGTVERLAASFQLSPGRLPAVFLVLRRNTRTWMRDPFPAPGERRRFGSDPAVFQYVPGQGMGLHVLGTWGIVNAQLRSCLRAKRSGRLWQDCPVRDLERRLDRLGALGARRGGFLAWEYYYAYAEGSPPWISGMAQATAVQALSRAARAFGAPRYRRLAQHALGAFETAPPAGVAVDDPGGRRYVMYSFAPGMRILNGELQAVAGLHAAAALGRSARAARLARRGDRAALAALAGFDTGAWSLYSTAGDESSLSYHRLTTEILGRLCRTSGVAAYCAEGRRFDRYTREPPRVGLAPLRGLTARRRAAVRFSLSKGSAVAVRVWGRRGLLLARDLRLGRGDHELDWTPPARGRFRVRVAARGPEGRLGVGARFVRVTLPKPKPRRRALIARRRAARHHATARVDEASVAGR
jgi:D-glucuronyl C5-epimerase C-terminus